jgi:6-phosphofructokinase 1
VDAKVNFIALMLCMLCFSEIILCYALRLMCLLILQDYFSKQNRMVINLKHIDPTYMIRAIPSNASDSVYCTLLAQSAVHGAMAGYTGFTVGPVNGRHSYLPFYRIIEKQNKVVITDRMWARLLSSTNQPSFLSAKDVIEDKKEEELSAQMLDEDNYSDDNLENKEVSYTF